MNNTDSDAAIEYINQLKLSKDNVSVWHFVNYANQQTAELRAEVERLKTALAEAADDLADWGAYASEYFQQKHEGTVKRYRDLAQKNEV